MSPPASQIEPGAGPGSVSSNGNTTGSVPALDLQRAVALVDRLVGHVETVFRGKPQIVRNAATAVICGGHLLLEDVPGVGKTTLAMAFARAIGCSFRRIQFTSDLLPSDILGVSILNRETHQFEFREGPIFSQVVLADEINRATPRSQSALLEAMSDGTVSIETGTLALPSPFWVVATQNPLESYGTYPLPESQLDRFFMRLSVGYPSPEDERVVIRAGGMAAPAARLSAIMAPEHLVALHGCIEQVRAEPVVVDYVMKIVERSRQSPAFTLGCSPRGAIALFRAARAHALVGGRTYCAPDDVLEVAPAVLSHRVVPAGGAEGDRDAAEATVLELLSEVPVPV